MSWLDAFFVGVTTVQSNGTPFPQQPNLNLLTGFALANNATNGSTDVSLSGVPVTALAIGGSNGYVLTNVSGTPAWAAAPSTSVTWASDLFGSTSTSQVVISAQNALIGFTATTGAIHWATGATAPALSIATAASAATPVSITLAPQAPNSGSTTLAANTPGSLIVALAAPGSSGTAGAEAAFQITRGGTSYLQAGTFAGFTGGGFIWLGSGVTPSATNYTVTSSSSSALLNHGSQTSLAIAGTAVVNVTSSSVTMVGVAALSANALAFVASASATVISKTAPGSDLVPGALNITAPSAFAGAATNVTGASITLTPGAGATTNGTPGSLTVALSAPSGTGVLPYLKVTQASTAVALIGALSPAFQTYGALWLGVSATAPTSGNYALFGDPTGSFVSINSPGVLLFSITNTNLANLSPNGFQFFDGLNTSFGGGSQVIGISNATTAPITAIASGCVLFHDSLGLHSWEAASTTGLGYTLAPVQSGTPNTQVNLRPKYDTVTRTTNASSTTILSLPLATSGTSGSWYIQVEGRETAGVGVGDAVHLMVMVSAKNVGGTVTATNSNIKLVEDTSLSAVTFGVAVSGTSVLLQVAAVASTTVDWSAAVFSGMIN